MQSKFFSKKLAFISCPTCKMFAKCIDFKTACINAKAHDAKYHNKGGKASYNCDVGIANMKAPEFYKSWWPNYKGKQ